MKVNMAPQKTDYSEILKFNAAEAWDKLRWQTIEENGLPENDPGIYQLILKSDGKNKIAEVNVCNKEEAGIYCNNLGEGDVILSVGKTKKLRTRLQQHFGNNDRANRLKRRCKTFFGLEDVSLDNLTEHKLQIKYTIIEEWWKRDLLESYGKAVNCCLFDLEIEH